MASGDLPGMIWELMLVARPIETHLSQSSIPGGSSPLVRRDDDNGLITQAVLFPADNVIKEVAAASVTVGVIAGITVGVIAGITVGIVALKATPHVKHRFTDLKSKLNRKSEDTVEAATQKVRPEQPDMGIEEPRSENRRLYAA
ncbi:hypothetical protein SMD20_33685 [Nonomuraea sp. LP-02]|uniref:hypothetical protein n=1 Tax=Nonomuraea sp. LP-02 TaxID=3097960 RepID=UPI002E37F50D|nr:hypothetical protein [Nonomuraea sp. LP-02]MED7929238.1 hypothetical protein [Nonomuraea sp. LP-02]